ncbi:hypothetical protein BELL_0281g00030 [Botrytis elliptica]|uniref:Uncharacterized protein n=1 Tax=Botrytis elliptica TaxID=278938 RepID=A0A4Z1JL27_9HELO|nr:hypothetical protein BELL_0281g00030 [Botrytis elliptica]
MERSQLAKRLVNLTLGKPRIEAYSMGLSRLAGVYGSEGVASAYGLDYILGCADADSTWFFFLWLGIRGDGWG